VGTVMGVPITALDRVVGEISLMRDGHLASPFTEEDEVVAVEAALALGVRLPALLAGYVGAYGPDPGVPPGRLPTSGITKSLLDLLRQYQPPEHKSLSPHS
ncbi:MAG TPA: hypothetical protein VMT88_14415, partial [Actinomycetes bacterium]|nr:hypothetical protein [Actinomycetes bacterium]